MCMRKLASELAVNGGQEPRLFGGEAALLDRSEELAG
jgi:hypothetical protein